MARIRRRRDRRTVMTGVMTIWATIVSLFLLWEIVQYRGLMAILAEWQFNTFGIYYPSLTYIALVAVLVFPGLLFFVRVRGRHSKQRLVTATLRSAIVFRRMVFSIAAMCAIVAFLALLPILTMPRATGSPHDINLAQPVVTLPVEGATTIDGAILYDRTAAFNEDLLIAHHNLRFAPIVAPGVGTRDLQFFVELPPEGVKYTNAAGSMTGTLKKNALPGELVRLYRYAGYRVEPPYYVLFADDATMRWPYVETAVELAMIALLFLIIGLWQIRRVHRLEEAVKQPLTA